MKFSRLCQIAADTVAATRRKLPQDLRDASRAVAVHCEKEPDASVLADGFEPDILGLFTGPEHGAELSQDNPVPPQILLYINSLWDYSEGDIDTFREEVRVTYLHELGHFFGWDEGQVAARGLD